MRSDKRRNVRRPPQHRESDRSCRADDPREQDRGADRHRDQAERVVRPARQTAAGHATPFSRLAAGPRAARSAVGGSGSSEVSWNQKGGNDRAVAASATARKRRPIAVAAIVPQGVVLCPPRVPHGSDGRRERGPELRGSLSSSNVDLRTWSRGRRDAGSVGTGTIGPACSLGCDTPQCPDRGIKADSADPT